jgi:hypothetical protein
MDKFQSPTFTSMKYISHGSFGYPLGFIVSTTVVPTMFIAMFAFFAWAGIDSGNIFPSIMFWLLCVFFLVFLPGLIFGVSTITINESGISSHIFHFCTQRYKWEDVLRIVKTGRAEGPVFGGEYVDVIHLDGRERLIVKNLFGVIRFSRDISNYASLLELVNKYADLRLVKRFYVDEKFLLAQSDPIARKRLATFGVPVSKL